MEIEKFIKFYIEFEGLDEDFDYKSYTEKTGRIIPKDIRGSGIDCLLFISWLREEARCTKKSFCSASLRKSNR